MALVNNSFNSMASQYMPQILGMLSTVVQEIGSLMQNPQFSGGLNMGPSTDTMTPNNNIFAGGLPSGSSPYGGSGASGGSPYGSQYAPQKPAGYSPYGGSSPYGSPSGCPSPTAGGSTDMSPTPTGSGATPAPTASGATPTPSASGGGNSDYVNKMIKALKDCGAPDSLIDAYKKQYQLLGLMPSDGSSSPTPTAGGGRPPAPGGKFYQPPGGRPTPTGGGTPTAGGSPSPISPVSGGGATSPELSGSGKVDWAHAPANLKKLQPYIQKAAAATGTPEAIIAGTIWQESGGNVNVSATDGGTDQGLMQIDNTTYDAEVAGQNGLPHGTTPTDPAQNIMAGATYLARMKQKFGSWDLALRGYNSGENGVDVHDPNARPAGTGDPTYVISIRQHVKNLEAGTPPANRG